MKNLFIGAIVMMIITAIAFTAGTIAYFTDGEDDRLIISADGSNLSGKIVETTVLDGSDDPVYGPTTLRIVPGATVNKTVAIENTGTMSMYLRVSVDKVFFLAPENEGSATDPALVSIEVNEAFWELRDGFYYYKEPLLRGETTEPLFTEIKFSQEMGNVYEKSTIAFVVKAYATQILSDATSVFDVTSWPDVQ